MLARQGTAVSLQRMPDVNSDRTTGNTLDGDAARRRERRLLTVPNTLSMSRVVLAAIFPFVHRPLPQAVLIGLAAISDFLDGLIARARHTASKWGALLDPITDRVFVIVALATYIFVGALTTGEYFTMIARDLATAIGFLVARAVPSLQRVTFKARWAGKLTTAVQLLVLVAVPLAPTLVRPLVIAVGVLSVWAILDYTIALQRARRAAAAGVVLLLLAVPRAGHAQQHAVVVPELRIDATSARIPRLEMSAGAVVPIGIYVRLALTAGGGVARENTMTHATARGDAIARFELDPLKQHTRGAYVGGGLSLLGRDGPHVGAYLALVAGLELKARAGWVPGIEAGLGGGARFAIALKRAMELWR